MVSLLRYYVILLVVVILSMPFHIFYRDDLRSDLGIICWAVQISTGAPTEYQMLVWVLTIIKFLGVVGLHSLMSVFSPQCGI